MSRKKTNIEISNELWRELNRRKNSPGDTFEAVIRRGMGLDRAKEQPVNTDIRPQKDVSGVDELKLPGSGDDLAARQETVRRMYAYLRQHGTATKSDFLELVDVEAVGYASAESFWSNVIKTAKALQQLPGVEPPASGGTEWRYSPPRRE